MARETHHRHPVVICVYPAQIQIGEEQRGDGHHVGADEQPDSDALSSVDFFRRLVMSGGTPMHLALWFDVGDAH
jgi:hypothetical protein